MVFLILIPIFLLPIFLICYHLYQHLFDGNSLMLGLAVLIIVLGVSIYMFYKFHWDEKLTLRTSKYAFRFNDEREKSKLPLLTSDFIQQGLTWNTKSDSVSDRTHFVLLQKTIEENDAHDAAEHEFNFLAKALNDSQVLYLKIDYNFNTKNYYGETTYGKLTRPSYKINNLQIFDECCTRFYKKNQVDSLMINFKQ